MSGERLQRPADLLAKVVSNLKPPGMEFSPPAALPDILFGGGRSSLADLLGGGGRCRSCGISKTTPLTHIGKPSKRQSSGGPRPPVKSPTTDGRDCVF